MNYTAPITTTTAPHGMSQQHEFATGGKRARTRRPSPTLFFVVMKTLRVLLEERGKGRPAVIPARLRKAAEASTSHNTVPGRS